MEPQQWSSTHVDCPPVSGARIQPAAVCKIPVKINKQTKCRLLYFATENKVKQQITLRRGGEKGEQRRQTKSTIRVVFIF